MNVLSFQFGLSLDLELRSRGKWKWDNEIFAFIWIQRNPVWDMRRILKSLLNVWKRCQHKVSFLKHFGEDISGGRNTEDHRRCDWRIHFHVMSIELICDSYSNYAHSFEVLHMEMTKIGNRYTFLRSIWPIPNAGMAAVGIPTSSKIEISLVGKVTLSGVLLISELLKSTSTLSVKKWWFESKLLTHRYLQRAKVYHRN